MPRVAGKGGSVWVRAARPVPFAGVPLVRCVDGGWWRVTDRTRRILDPLAVPVVRCDGQVVDVRQIVPAGGRLQIDVDADEPLLADGWFYPHALLGRFADWDLETEVRLPDTSTLGETARRQTAVIAGAAVLLTGCDFDTAAAAGRGPLVVDMQLSDRLAHTGVGRAQADTPGLLHVTFGADELALAAA